MKFDREVAAAAAEASLQASRQPLEDDYNYPGGYSNQPRSVYSQPPMASYIDPRRYSDAPGMAGVGAQRPYAPYADRYEQQQARQSYTQPGPDSYIGSDGMYGPPARASNYYYPQDPYVNQPLRSTYSDLAPPSSPYSQAYQPVVPENTLRSQSYGHSAGSHAAPSSQPAYSEETYRSDRALSPDAAGAIRSRMIGSAVSGAEGRRESDGSLDRDYELRRREILKVTNQ